MIWTYVLHYINILSPETSNSYPFLQPLPGWLFIGHGFWFCLGLVLAFYREHIQTSLERIKEWLVVMLMLVYILGIIEWEYLLQNSGREWIGPRMTLVDAVYIILFLLAFLALEKYTLPFTSQFNELGARSYGIYLVHSIILFVATKLIYRFVPAILGYQIIYQPLLVAVGIGTPILLMEFVYRSQFRPFYEHLFGRR
jgi:membrane-bound acyltransferase YfiQ involved in biofilm formation